MPNILKYNVAGPQRFDPGAISEMAIDDYPCTDGQPLDQTQADTTVSRTPRTAQRQRFVPTAIVDRSTMFRIAMLHIFRDSQFRVVAECATLDGLPARALNSSQLLLLVGLDNEEGEVAAALSQVSRLKERSRGLKAIMFGERFEPNGLRAAIAAGADGYVLKNEISPDVLLKSLDLALLGAMVVPHRLMHSVLQGWTLPVVDRLASADTPGYNSEPAQPHCAIAGLSNREEAILLHLMEGASNKHIARVLDIAEATVKVHVKSLLRKTRARNRTQAAMWGQEQRRAGRSLTNFSTDFPA